jgi:thiol-disulfide isomerase/thioredoxin
MLSRWVLFFMVAINAFSSHANRFEWLNQIIAEKENVQQGETLNTMKKQDKGFFREHGFILFYASSCSHCHQFAPVLKRWADKHQAAVLPLAFDNQPLLEFPHYALVTTEWVNAAFQGAPFNIRPYLW